MRPIDADVLEKEGWSLHRTIQVDKNTEEYQTKPLKKVPTIEPEPHWILRRERLPEYSGRYLVSVLDGIDRRTTVAPYHPQRRTWTLTGRMAYWKVIAWMPLPEPYREGEGC